MPVCHFCSYEERCRLSGTNPTEDECEREMQRMEEEDDIHNEIVADAGLVSSTENEFIFEDDEEEDDDIVSMFETTHPDDTCVREDDEVDTTDPWYTPDDENEEE